MDIQKDARLTPRRRVLGAVRAAAQTCIVGRPEGASVVMSTSVEITWLLAAVAKGDAVAFERLYGATCANLYGVVLRILRRHDLAADVMEQAYLQIRRDAGQFDPAHSGPLAWMVAIATIRSEEHTSELQSLTNLVCRLLLEKKKKKITNN